MLDGTISKLQVILQMSKLSLKEIRTHEREKVRQKIANLALKRFWLYERILQEAKTRHPQRLMCYFCN